MTWQATLFWLANMACDTIGQLSFKAASLSAGELEGWAHWKKLARSPFLWLGISAFVLEFVFWLSFLALVPLAMGLFVGSANMILVMIGGRLFFDEKLTSARLGAIGLIVIGVVLVGWGAA
jgi:drug/metabolite transporter (DMT)-like permease